MAQQSSSAVMQMFVLSHSTYNPHSTCRLPQIWPGGVPSGICSDMVGPKACLGTVAFGDRLVNDRIISAVQLSAYILCCWESGRVLSLQRRDYLKFASLLCSYELMAVL